MSGRIAARLKELGLTLPKSPVPVANYVPYVKTGNLIFVSGQIPAVPGEPPRYVGIVGTDISAEDAKAAARLAAINVLAVLDTALNGNLDQVTRVVKLTGFVNAAPGFTAHPEIVNGASDLFVEVFGDDGRHARAAVGTGSLPRNVAVEIDAVFEVM
jgi:enamine deaminase RidA (YjgF/YER057c/UK114 family)